MSEIKGQLLGIVLVLMVFGIVAVGLHAAFQNLTNTVSSQVANAANSVI